jgi:hypothetical protein
MTTNLGTAKDIENLFPIFIEDICGYHPKRNGSCIAGGSKEIYNEFCVNGGISPETGKKCGLKKLFKYHKILIENG